MKSTGIVRRIDDLGRVVIPKETRKMLDLKEGDPMEFYIDGDKIFLRKYEPMDSPKSLIRELLECEQPTNIFVPSQDLIQRMREVVN